MDYKINTTLQAQSNFIPATEVTQTNYSSYTVLLGFIRFSKTEGVLDLT